MSSPEKRERKPARRFDDETYPAGAPRRKGKGTSGLALGQYGGHSAPGVSMYPQQPFVLAPARPRASGMGGVMAGDVMAGGVMAGGGQSPGELDVAAGLLHGVVDGGDSVAYETTAAADTALVTGGGGSGDPKEGEEHEARKSNAPEAANTASTKSMENVQDVVSLSLLASHMDPSHMREQQQQLQHAAAVLQAQQERKCNCKNSKCLKLYCECFASGRYCDGCNCQNCHNTKDREDVRRVAVASVLERNPNAFQPKLQATKGTEKGVVVDVKHNRGCNCRKSNCLKKYCECFQAGVLCTESCRCRSCKNFQSNGYQSAPVEPEEKIQIRSSTRRKRAPPPKDMLHVGVSPSNLGLQPNAKNWYHALHGAAPALDHDEPAESVPPDMLRHPSSTRVPTLSLTAEQIKTITSMCLSDVINPTILKQTCMLITLLADENLKGLMSQDTTTGATLEEKVDEVCAQQKLAIDEEFVETSRKILATIKTKLEERRDKFQQHQNTVYSQFMSPQKPMRWKNGPDPSHEAGE